MPKMHTEAPGRRALLEAAIRLAANGRCINSLGLRELAREAGLNPNTFYRHFTSMEEMGLVMIEECAEQMHGPLRALRQSVAASLPLQPGEWGPQQAERGRQVSEATVKMYFDHALANQQVLMVGLRELHGPSPRLRAAVQTIMQRQSRELAEDMASLGLLPKELPAAVLLSLASMISRNLFYQALDLIGAPEQYPQLHRSAVDQIIMLCTGAAFLQATGGLDAPAGPPG